MFRRKKKSLSLPDFLKKYPNLRPNSNSTAEMLEKGTERNLRSIKCAKYRHMEQMNKLNRMFPEKRTIPEYDKIDCSCDWCSGKRQTLLEDELPFKPTNEEE